MRRTLHFISTPIVLFAIIASNAQAQESRSLSKVGTTAAQFLKIGGGARPLAMGSAYSAVSDDISGVFWNPAGLSRIAGGGEAMFTHAEWLADIDYDFAAFSVNVSEFGAMALHVISLRTPEDLVRTVTAPEGTGQVWNFSSITMGITFARNLTDRFSIGMTGKYVQENIFNETSRGAAFDLGVHYYTPFRNLRLGAAITNFGSKLRLDGRDIFFNEDPLAEEGPVEQVPSKYRLEGYEMPLTLRFGLAWEVLRDDNFSLIASADGTHPNDNTEYLNVGAELGLRNILFLRGGYKTLSMRDSEQGLTLGAGLRYDAVGTNLKLDFAWADFGRLDNVQFVTLSIRY